VAVVAGDNGLDSVESVEDAAFVEGDDGQVVLTSEVLVDA